MKEEDGVNMTERDWSHLIALLSAAVSSETLTNGRVTAERRLMKHIVAVTQSYKKRLIEN